MGKYPLFIDTVEEGLGFYAQRQQELVAQAIANIRPRSKSEPKPRIKLAGFVYLLQAANGLYKIGRTKNAKTRIAGITTSSPIAIETVAICETIDMVFIEQALHTHFEKKRQHGEWFALNDDDVQYILEWLS